MNTRHKLLNKRIVNWLLALTSVIYLITGFGITQFRVVESLTFGLLTKNLAFRIHNILWIPFLILLILHISVSYLFKSKE
jgi:cytochrome b subunit of formate dehydrogenase